MVKEACVETLDQAIRAEQLGADQLELCSRLDLDGLTPSFELTESVLKRVQIPVKVMIRPREGNFVYTSEEVGRMIESIGQFKAMGVAGIVIGVLTKDNEIDREATHVLAQSADSLSVTFHKAIDLTPDLIRSIQTLDSIKGMTHVLTSGAKPSAISGIPALKKMLEFRGHLSFIVAGGVTDQNLHELHLQLGAEYYHGKKIVGLLPR